MVWRTGARGNERDAIQAGPIRSESTWVANARAPCPRGGGQPSESGLGRAAGDSDTDSDTDSDGDPRMDTAQLSDLGPEGSLRA